MAGRPSIFTDEIANEICERLAGGENLKNICEEDGMPGFRTVFTWLAEREEFQQKYARAKEAQAEVFAEEILNISDDGRNDYVVAEEDGKTVTRVDFDHIQRSKLRVDSRKWLLSKMLPKKYGDATTLKHADPDGNALKVEVTRISGKE